MGQGLDDWNETRKEYGREAFKRDMQECEDRVLRDPQVKPLLRGTQAQRDFALTIQTRTLAYILKEARVVKLGVDGETLPFSTAELKAAYRGLGKIDDCRWWADRKTLRPSAIIRQWIETGQVAKPDAEEIAMTTAERQERTWERRLDHEAAALAALAAMQREAETESNSPRPEAAWQRLLDDEIRGNPTTPRGAETKARWVAFYGDKLAAR